MILLLIGLSNPPEGTEITIWLGLLAVYLMVFLRMGLTERSHLIEYSVLAIFIHKALIERTKGNKVLVSAFIAWIATLATGVLDECIQIFLPDRVFDPVDILFNGLAGFMAIGSSVLLQWIRKKVKKRK